MEAYSIKFFDRINKVFFIGMLSITLVNCGGRDQSEETDNADSVVYVRDTADANVDLPETSKVINKLIYIINYDDKTISRNLNAGNNQVIDSVINNLNAKYPKIILEKLKHSRDTLYTVIKNSEVLGEQMGTTGASEYIATTVLNLTSLPGIRFVKIDMDEHSHVSPGVFSRKQFNEFKEIPVSK